MCQFFFHEIYLHLKKLYCCVCALLCGGSFAGLSLPHSVCNFCLLSHIVLFRIGFCCCFQIVQLTALHLYFFAESLDRFPVNLFLQNSIGQPKVSSFSTLSFLRWLLRLLNPAGISLFVQLLQPQKNLPSVRCFTAHSRSL